MIAQAGATRRAPNAVITGPGPAANTGNGDLLVAPAPETDIVYGAVRLAALGSGKCMITATSSIATSIMPAFDVSGGGLLAGSGNSAGFGPDFLMSALGSQTLAPGAVYDVNGNLVSVGRDSPDTKARTAALKSAKDLLGAGDTVGARDAANSVLARNPSDAIAAAYVGRTYLKEGNYREAVKYFSRAASGSDDAQIKNDLSAAQTLAKGTAATVDEIHRLMRQNATALKGVQLASYLLDVEPSNLDARLALVNYYDQQGKTNLAGAELTDELSTVPAGRLDEFVAAVEKFNQAHADQAASYDLLAQTYVKAGRLTDAQPAFQKALDLAGDDVTFQTQIKQDYANVYLERGRQQAAQGNEDEAIRLFQQGLDIFSSETGKSDLSNLELERGQREIRQGRLKQALEDLNIAQAYLPGTADAAKKGDLIHAFESLATRFGAIGDLKSVIGARNGAFLLDPKNDTRKRALADAYDAYGLDRLASRDYGVAIRQFRSALSYYKDDANYAAHFAEAQSHL